MIKKFNKYSLKFCRFYDEDIFGRYAIRPKTSHKVLNVLYYDLLKQNHKLRFLYKNYIKCLFYIKKQVSFLRTFIIRKNKSLKSRKKFNKSKNKFKFKFRIKIKNKFYNLRKNIFSLLNNLQKSLQLFKLDEGKFNYRVDIGKPKKEKRKVTRFSVSLLTRHKLTAFAGKIPIYQFKQYTAKKRNLKYFSMHFLFVLESRVDTILYRLNFSNSPGFIRQFIKHKGVLVNNKLITTPSFRISLNDTLSFINKREIFNKIFFNFYKRIVFMSLPMYYEFNFRTMSFCFFMVPHVETIFYPFKVDKLRLSSFKKHF